MKSCKYVILSFMIMCVSAFCFAGCLFTIGAPSITRDGAVISWQEIENANGYEILLSDGKNEQTLSTTQTSFDLTPYISDGEYLVSVKAKTEKLFYRDSVYSDVLRFVVSNCLDFPTGLVVNNGDNEYSVNATWNQVEYATGYTIKVESTDGIKTKTVGNVTSANIYELFSKSGAHKVSIRATSSVYNGLEGIFVSDYSEAITHNVAVKLVSPDVTSFEKVGASYKLSWNPVSEAVSYNVSLLGSDAILNTTATCIDVSQIEGGLPKIATLKEMPTDALQIAFVQAVGDGSSYSSDFSLGIVCFGISTNETNLGNLCIDYFYSIFLKQMNLIFV